MKEIEEKPIKDMKKAVCPHCGHKQYPFYEKDANCRGVFLKCKNPACRKQFELKI